MRRDRFHSDIRQIAVDLDISLIRRHGTVEYQNIWADRQLHGHIDGLCGPAPAPIEWRLATSPE